MIIALIAVAAVVVVVCIALLVARHRTFGVSLPRVRGRLGLAGLVAEVTVARDRWGVPHLNATSMEDAAFAVGVVHAQDRLWQMEVTRRVATGRISEVATPVRNHFARPSAAIFGSRSNCRASPITLSQSNAGPGSILFVCTWK